MFSRFVKKWHLGQACLTPTHILFIERFLSLNQFYFFFKWLYFIKILKKNWAVIGFQWNWNPLVPFSSWLGSHICANKKYECNVLLFHYIFFYRGAHIIMHSAEECVLLTATAAAGACGLNLFRRYNLGIIISNGLKTWSRVLSYQRKLSSYGYRYAFSWCDPGLLDTYFRMVT